jgi:predicted ABC-type ATPase
MKTKGYEIHIYFLWLRSVDLALKRVAERVAMGGHDVPAYTVRRRFGRGLHNLFHLYHAFADSLVIFDNSELAPRVVAKETAGVRTVICNSLCAEVRRVGFKGDRKMRICFTRCRRWYRVGLGLHLMA